MTQASNHEFVPLAIPGIFAVVVLYKMLPAESPCLRTLLEAVEAVSPNALQLHVLVVDNTPGGQSVGELPDGVHYRAAPDNPGLSVAYNAAMRAASEGNFPWLLTLDQDTSLPKDFLTILLRHIEKTNADERIAVLAGHMVDGARPLGPFRFAGGFWPVVLPLSFTGLAEPFASTLNSASLLRVSALQSIGGYDERFPLNNSDTSLFHQLGRAGRRMHVIAELIIPHELAIMDRERRMTPERYRQLLADERACWDLHMNAAARAERLIKLAGRLVKSLLEGERKDFRKLTFDELRYRLLTRRRERMKVWKQSNPGSHA